MITINKLKKKSTNLPARELFFFYFLFTAAIYLVYRKPGLALPFFLSTLVLSFLSKKNYFWIAFFFLILQTPAWFFLYSPNYHLPMIFAIPGFSLTPIDIFTIVMSVKFIIYRKHIELKLKVPFIILLIYFIFSFFLGGIVFSTSLDAIGGFARTVIYIIWIVFIVAFLKEIEDIFKFLELMLPIAFFILFSQIYSILNGGAELISLFNPEAGTIISLNTLTGEVRAGIGGFLALFCCYFSAFFLTQFEQNKKRKRYYYIITVVCFLSVFLSATRFAFGVFLLIALVIYSKKLKELPKIIIFVAGTMLVLMLLVKFGVFSETYLRTSLWDRISQVFDFVAGKGAQIDTFASRLEQLQYMAKGIWQSPFFGYGFSDESVRYFNNNWGFPNTLIMFGFFGFLLFIFLFKSYLTIIIATSRKAYVNPEMKAALKVLLATFLGMLLGYFTTWDFFSLFYPNVVAFNMMFFGLSEILLKHTATQAKNQEEKRQLNVRMNL